MATGAAGAAVSAAFKKGAAPMSATHSLRVMLLLLQLDGGADGHFVDVEPAGALLAVNLERFRRAIRSEQRGAPEFAQEMHGDVFDRVIGVIDQVQDDG